MNYGVFIENRRSVREFNNSDAVKKALSMDFRLDVAAIPAFGHSMPPPYEQILL